MDATVVFLPGSLCDAALFQHQLASLASAGHSVAVADLTRSSSIADMAADVLGDFGGELVLVGLSMGAIVAADAARQSVGRVLGLALLDTNLAAPDERQLSQRRDWVDQVGNGDFDLLVSGLVEHLTAEPDRHREEVEAMAHRVGPAAFLRQNAALLDRHDRRPDLDEVGCPILVGCGALDALCPPAMHAAIASNHPRAVHRVFDHAGHLATIDQPEALSGALLEWLSRMPRPTAAHHQQQGRPEQ